MERLGSKVYGHLFKQLSRQLHWTIYKQLFEPAKQEVLRWNG